MLNIASVLTPIAAQEESIEGTLIESVHQIKEDEKFMIDAWTGDANGILAFVSLSLLIPFLSSQ